ncbi:MAG: hypothetical protein ABI646_09405, partial [Acidobacteriota bacterium]
CVAFGDQSESRSAKGSQKEAAFSDSLFSCALHEAPAEAATFQETPRCVKTFLQNTRLATIQ